MPFDNGRFTTTRENFEDRRRRILSKRFVNQRKECQVPELSLRNAEYRPMFMLASGFVYYVLVPVSAPLQGPEPRNLAPTIDGLKAISSPPAVVSHADLRSNSEHAKLVSSGQSSETLTLDQHRNGTSLALPQSSSSDSLLTPLASGDSHSIVNGNMNSDGSDFTVKDAFKVKKKVKRSSKKKGKKKGKQQKQTKSRKVSAKSDVQNDPKSLLSTFPDGIEELCFDANIKFDDASSSPSVENSGSSSLTDSFHDGWNTDISAIDSEDMETTLTIKGSNGVVLSCMKETDVLPCSSSTDSFPVTNELLDESTHPYWSNDALDTCSILERAECSSQASSSDDFHPVVYGKRNRRTRKIIDNGNFSRFDGFLVKTADNQIRKDAKTSIFRPSDSTISRTHDDRPSKASKTFVKQGKTVNQQDRFRRSCQYHPSDEKCTYKESRQMVNTVKSSQPLAKHTLGNFLNNVKYRQSSRSKSYNGMGNRNIVDNRMAHTEAHQTSPVSHNTKTTSCVENHCVIGSTQLSAEADDFCKSEREQEMNSPVSLGDNYSSACDSAPYSCSDLDHVPTRSDSDSQMLESDNSASLGDPREDVLLQAGEKYPKLKLEIPTSLPEEGDLRNSIGTVLKLDHVDRNVVAQDDKSTESSRMSDVDEPFCCTLDSNNGKVPLPDSNTLPIYPSLDNGFLYSKPSSKNIECLSAGSLCLTDKVRTFPYCTHSVKCQEPPEFQDDLGKITQAAVDAYKLHTAAEVVQKIVGSPIADYEKFLNSASPVIGQIHSSTNSAVCCQERTIICSTVSHSIPDFPLKKLWQWYEEPGCFGLEVKELKNEKLKMSNNHGPEFNAYFVPYLSAVQIFGQSGSVRCCKCFEDTNKASEAHKTPYSMESMLSLVHPKPCNEVGNCLSGVSAENELSDQPVMNNVDGGELLFEYFESDQPSWRPPLFEKMKDLVNDQMSSRSQIFGNPETLESLNLQDIHPASWYSVAWYPICRIPEGNIRAAFLTYHSLGHISYRSLTCNTGSLQNVVCPVLGLQTYNDKGEGWFQPRVPDSKVPDSKNALYTKPSELVRERLRTLRETASVMATAVVSKNNKRSINKHPDHDFFLSRSR